MAERGALWQWLIDALDAGQAAALLTVVETNGSSPAKIGAKLALTSQHCFGTIGGGPLEVRMIRTTRSMLTSVRFGPHIVRMAHHPSETIQPSGAICGGEQVVLVYPCRLEDRSVFMRLLESCRSRIPLNLTISTNGLTIIQTSQALSVGKFSGGDSWQYQETLGQGHQAFIVGGGHVSLALSKILDWLNYDVTVIDEREALDTMRMNSYARQKWTMPYNAIAEHIPEGSKVFVFVMTHNHKNDELVLTQLLKKQFAYLGLLGSHNKINQLKSNLAKQFSAEKLQQLQAPMGLPIKSHTPEEIAVSIAADLIQMNANRR